MALPMEIEVTVVKQQEQQLNVSMGARKCCVEFCEHYICFVCSMVFSLSVHDATCIVLLLSTTLVLFLLCGVAAINAKVLSRGSKDE